MLKVLCPASLEEAYIECGCPDGHDPAAEGAHHENCPMWAPGDALSCPASAGCCQEDHSHDTAGGECKADHSAEACPEPAGKCRLWNGLKQHAQEGGDPLPAELEGDCPGGHCHARLDSCAVCHPVIITLMPGTTLQKASA